MKKIKILHIIKSLGRGGAERMLLENLRLHDHSRFEFHFIYFLPWKDQLVEELLLAGGKVECFPAKHNLAIIQQIPGVIKYIQEQQIDGLHCHLPWAGILGRLIHKKMGIPVFYTEHNLQERYHPLTRKVNHWTYGWQTAVFAVSQKVKQSIEHNFSPQIPLMTLSNGINPDYFSQENQDEKSQREKWGIAENQLVIGTVAVFRTQKRLLIWLEVFAELTKNHPTIVGLIVGDGPLKDDITAKIRELNLEDKILMPGLQKEVRPFLAMMDIFMMSSEFEGLPLALLEAMSMECAIVSTDAGGVDEVIRHKIDGLLVPVRSPYQLTNELNSLLNQPEKITRFAKAARKRVKEEFDLIPKIQFLEKKYLVACGDTSHG